MTTKKHVKKHFAIIRFISQYEEHELLAFLGYRYIQKKMLLILGHCPNWPEDTIRGVWVGLRAYPGNPSYPASHRRTIHPSHNVFGTSLRRTTSSRQNIFYETSVVSLKRERWPWWWGNNSSSEFGFSLGALRDVQIVFLFFNFKSMSIKQDRAFPSKRSHRQNMNSCGQGANPIKSNPHITFYLHSSQCTVFVGQAPEW